MPVRPRLWVLRNPCRTTLRGFFFCQNFKVGHFWSRQCKMWPFFMSIHYIYRLIWQQTPICFFNCPESTSKINLLSSWRTIQKKKIIIFFIFLEHFRNIWKHIVIVCSRCTCRHITENIPHKLGGLLSDLMQLGWGTFHRYIQNKRMHPKRCIPLIVYLFN